MPYDLISLACNEGVKLEYWDFRPPLEGVYWKHPGLPPIIGLAKTLFDNRRHFRTVLAEELGHHFTTAGDYVGEVHFHYGDRVNTSRAEYRARKWAARYLMPRDKLLNALRRGIVEIWDLSDCFEIDGELVRLRLEMLRAELTVRQFKREGDFVEFANRHLADGLGKASLRPSCHHERTGELLA